MVCISNGKADNIIDWGNWVVGSHLLNYLVRNKYKIVILKRSTSDISKIKKSVKQISAYDIDKQKIEVAFQQHKIDVVMHLATSYGKNKNYENLIQSTSYLD